MDKETGEVLESYSIITTEALAFVAKQGHDRSPYFIKEEGFKNWLSPEINKLEEALEILEKNKLKPELMAEVDRPMKPGWQKRAGLE
jgi:putative SOS response-associated peptidase YedK